MDITVHTLTFNEELIIQFFIDHYRSRFPGCHIVVYDNQSTDKTVEIAKNNDCEIRHMNTGGVADEEICIDIKNNCWRNAKTDWVIVCDTDELLDINSEQLDYEDSQEVTKIISESWQMINWQDNIDLKTITHGYRDVNDKRNCLAYDKDLLFNKKHIMDINYGPGCHNNNAQGIVKNSNIKYTLLHYKYINQNVFVKKQQVNRSRDTEKQKKNNWGGACHGGDAAQISEYQMVKNKSIQILFDNVFRKTN